MAQVTVIKAVEGPSNIVIRVNLMSDGSGELMNYPILAAQDLVPSRPNRTPSFSIRQAWWGFSWFDLTLFAGTLQPAQMWTFVRDTENHVDFRSFAGMLDQNIYIVPPDDDDGVLSITTNNFGPVGMQGTLVLDIQKMNQVSG